MTVRIGDQAVTLPEGARPGVRDAGFERAVIAVGEVEVQLGEAMAALKRCTFRTGDMPGGLKASWPDHANSDMALIEQLGMKTMVRPAPPQKREYDRMVEALGWLLWIEPASHRRIVMARASGIGWLKIRMFAGMSEPTLRKIYRLGLVTIAARLNAKG